MQPDFDISGCLSELARCEPDRSALIHPGGRLSFREIEEGSWRCARGLKNHGIGRGIRCVLMVPPGPEMVMLAFGLLRISAVPVMIDPGIGIKNLSQCLLEAEPKAFIGSSKAHLARLLFGWARRSIQLNVKIGWFPFAKGIAFNNLIRSGETSPHQDDLPKPEDTAAIVFTSGSTGVPKGVVYTHKMFNRQAQLLRDHFKIEPNEVDLATFPLFALFDPAWKATTVFPKMDFTRPGQVDPRNIVDAIEQNGVTHMFGSPALLNRVGQYCEKNGLVLPSLRRVLSAGAPVPDKVLERFASILPEGSQVHTPYGATEALPVCSISQSERARLSTTDGKGVCVGKPMPGVNLCIIGISDGPITHWSETLTLTAGEIGEIVVWGDNVSTEYFERPEATRQAKIYSDDGVVRHRMGDLGYLDEAGRVWFCGRKSHRVQTAEGTLFSVPCEGVFNQHPAVFRTALVGVGLKPNQVPVLCVELEPETDRAKSVQIRTELFKLGASIPVTRGIKTILFHNQFPVDIRHNSKIFREKLADWAESELR